MDIKGVLTKSYAGVPGWLIAAAGGVAIWWFFLRGSSADSSSNGVSADSAYGLGYAQGLQYAAGNVPGSPAPPQPANAGVSPGSGYSPRPSGIVTLPPPKNPTEPRSYPVGALPSNIKGIGGFGSRGSRLADWSGNYFHPALTRRVVYSHYVRAIGGPSAHDHEVARVARGSGIHVARLRALNPVYTGRIRVH